MTDEEIDARHDLRDLAERYARGADRRRPNDVADLFLPDGRLLIYTGDPTDGGTLNSDLQGREAIATAMTRLSRYRVTFHMLGQQHVDELDLVKGEASAETYCLAHHLSGEPTRNRVMAIRYLDRFRRSEEGWRIAERRLAVDWVSETLLES
jgi:hypothetical protein